MNQYKTGTTLFLKKYERKGIVVSSNELPPNKLCLKSDVCVKWESTEYDSGFISTYDTWWLNDNCHLFSNVDTNAQY